MDTNRRNFLKGSLWMGAAAMAAGCMSDKLKLAPGGNMAMYADKPMSKVRIAVVGLGRGMCAIRNFAKIPGCEIVAMADLAEARRAAALRELQQNGRPAPRVYSGAEDWKRMCEADDVDLIYNATPWDLHVPIALYAMEHGKHVCIEVPSAFTVEECWQLVETSERTRRHCMQLENCCYGESEMLALNLCRQGLLGELVHGEGAYIHDLRAGCYGSFLKKEPSSSWGYWNDWRLKHNIVHKGNQYPTHGLGPICQYMNINRGDKFDYLVSLESNQFSYELWGREKMPASSWKHNQKVAMGNMNTTLIRTALGRSIMVQHDVASPRPYSRINLISGTKGILMDYPLRIVFDEKGEATHSFFDAQKLAEVRATYKHPLWKTAGEIAKIMGGHGGMDFLMCLRIGWCLQMGLPLDQNVYDLASWCCLCELTEKSVRNRSASLDIPDFTRGQWKTTAPLGIEDVDLTKMKFDVSAVKNKKA